MSAHLRLETRTARQTEAIAKRIAQALSAPSLLVLDGDLGAGKTTFVRGFVRALPGAQNVVVQSPTYALMRRYPTTPPVHHLDLYRLDDPSSLDVLGLSDILDGDGHVIVEWARDFLDTTRAIRIGLSGSDVRTLTIDVPAAHPEHTRLLAVLRAKRSAARDA